MIDDKQIDPEWEQPSVSNSRARGFPYSVKRALKLEEYRGLAKHGRVFFFGEGSDNALMYEWQTYLKYLARNHRWSRPIRDVFQYGLLRTDARSPRRPFCLSASQTPPRCPQPEFPAWLDDDFAPTYPARARWETQRAHPRTPLILSVRSGLDHSQERRGRVCSNRWIRASQKRRWSSGILTLT